jgi:lycopene beta-cyclase
VATLQHELEAEGLMCSDLLILGGGCAGLSLARRLSALGPGCPQTVVLESRTAYADDRTWCFWSEPGAQLAHLVTHRWRGVYVAAKGIVANVDCRATPYAMIPSIAFYGESVSMIAQTPQIHLEQGVSVLTGPQKAGNAWHLETSAGTRSARMIVDTRPPGPPQRGEALLWQSFVGHEIECTEPVFQPDLAGIMDFAPVRGGRILFFYLLPFSVNRALLEVTILAEEPLGPDVFDDEMQQFLARTLRGRSYTVRRSEHGILPMGMPQPPAQADPSHVKAGVFSGGARPSSGYAFQRIQRWARDCARALGEGLPPLPHPRDPLPLRAMDALFLRVLRHQPELAPELFLTLFQKADSARLIRFLSDGGTPLDFAAIISALLPGPFLRGAFSALTSSRPP